MHISCLQLLQFQRHVLVDEWEIGIPSRPLDRKPALIIYADTAHVQEILLLHMLNRSKLAELYNRSMQLYWILTHWRLAY